MVPDATRLVARADVRLAPLAGAEIPRARVAWPDGAPGPVVDGRVLEAAYAFGAETLVVATDDVPFEDGLHVSLVTTTTVIDWLAQSAPYATGVFREIGLVGATLDFAFLGERALRLRVLAAPCLHVPMLFDRGDAFAWRPLRARTRLRLERRPRR